MPAQPACVVVLIHGVGNQKSTWSQPFQRALKAELGAAAGKVRLLDAYWAPVSNIREALRPTLAPTHFGVPETSLEDETYRRVATEYAQLLAAGAGGPVGARAFGLGGILGWLKKKFDMAEDVVADVANYLARNGVRTATQNVLHNKLGEAHQAGSAPVVIVSHSQGTIISYDVLRQAGHNYPALRTWITMGCPLRNYLGPLQWGGRQLGFPPAIRWLNLYDKKDFVGKDLRGVVSWPSPKPIDQVVDNAKQAGGAHNHWANPQVVRAVAGEVRRLLP